MRPLFVLVLALLLALPCFAQVPAAAVGAEAPVGFSWQADEATHVELLKPDGWFVRSETQGDTSAIFITREEIRPPEPFQTGLSLNVVHGVRQKTGVASSTYARTLLEQIATKHERLLEFANDDNGFANAGLRVATASPAKVIHYYAVSDDRRDLLFLFVFESPKEDWEAAWSIGEPMLKQIRIVLPE